MTYRVWRSEFAKIVDERFHPLEWLDRQVADGVFQCWATERAAILAELRTYPSGVKDVHGILAAGDVFDIVNVLIPQAEEWGKMHDCIGAVIESREGWSRALRPSGYCTHQTVVRKEF